MYILRDIFRVSKDIRTCSVLMKDIISIPKDMFSVQKDKFIVRKDIINAPKGISSIPKDIPVPQRGSFEVKAAVNHQKMRKTFSLTTVKQRP